MKKIYGFGDCHFTSKNENFLNAGRNFIKWLDDTDLGSKKDTEAVFAGDITDKEVIPGKTLDMLMSFLEVCSKKFSNTFIIIGNHDIKQIHDITQHTLEFVKTRFDNIHIIEEMETLVTPNGFNCLFMPFFIDTPERNLLNYYNNLPAEIETKSYDVICSHFDINFSNVTNHRSLTQVKLGHLTTKSWFCGHLHNDKDSRFLKSIYPLNFAEMSEKRYIKVLDEEKNESTLELPKFINYIKVSKEEDMNVSPKEYETIIYAFDDYTLLNKVDKSNIEIVQSKKISEDIQNIIKDKVSLFNEMLQETNLEISENVKKAVNEILQSA